MELTWFRRPSDDTPGTLNLCYNAVDRAVIEGRTTTPAADGSDLDLLALLEDAGALAGALRSLDIGPGSLVADTVTDPRLRLVVLLATLRLGAAHTDGSAGEADLTLDDARAADETMIGRADPAGCEAVPADAPALVRDGQVLDQVAALSYDDEAGRALAALVVGAPVELAR